MGRLHPPPGRAADAPPKPLQGSVRSNRHKTFSDQSGGSVHRLVVRMAAFQAVDMGSNPVERIPFYKISSYGLL